MTTKKHSLQGKNQTDSAVPSFVQKMRAAFAPRRQRHDPMLVLSMSIFNFEHGWSRVLNPLKTHESGAK